MVAVKSKLANDNKARYIEVAEGLEPSSQKHLTRVEFFQLNYATRRMSMRNWTKEEDAVAIQMIKQYCTYAEIGKTLNRTPKAVKARLLRIGIYRKDYASETLQCLTCNKCFEDLRSHNSKFCSQSCAAMFNNKIHKMLPRQSAPVHCLECKTIITTYRKGAKYCNHKCQGSHRIRLSFHAKKPPSRRNVRHYLLMTRPHQCEHCLNSKWQSKPIPLEVDHIDGYSNNNKEENLRLLCPNCHACTDTYKSKNRGKGRASRMKRYHAGLSY